MRKIKDKEKMLKATGEKQQIAYKGIPFRLSADFSTEILQAIREWHNIFKVMKVYNQEYLTQQDSHSELMEKSKAKLREFSTARPALQQILKELLQAGNTGEGKDLQKIKPKQLRKW